MRKLVIAGGGGLAVALAGAAIVLAGTPFGGDDTGTISSVKAVNKCEQGVAKGTGKLAAAIFKCHQSRAIGKLADDTAEDTCETTAKTNFTSKTKTTGCAACTNLASTAAAAEGLIDANNNKVYCTSTGTPFGGDDTGNIPTDAPKGAVTKCENGVAKGVSKLVGAIIKCHISRAAGKLADDTAEDTCESTAIGKFTSKTKTTGCDPCTNLASLGSFVETTLDGANSLAFCASSPSGAFLDSYGSF